MYNSCLLQSSQKVLCVIWQKTEEDKETVTAVFRISCLIIRILAVIGILSMVF
jgi:hypothetical protein